MHELNVLLKIEFKRLFKNKLFYISLFIGVVLATGSFINKVIPHMYMCVCYSVHCHTVVIFQGIITTSTYCSIIAEHRGIRCMQPDSLQHLFREECLSFCLY